MKRDLLHFLLVWLVLAATLSVPALAQTPPPEAATSETDGAEAEGTESGEPEADEPDDRISFNVKVEEGRVTGSAGDIQLEEGKYLIATGGVELKFKSLKLQADTVRLDIPINLLTADGNVILDDGPERLSGSTLEYNLDTQQGAVTQATAYVDPDYYFSGRQIAKTGDRTYTVDDGIFTSCEQEVPSWSFNLKRADITLDEYARIRQATMKFKKLPVLYVPYMRWPATTERTSGFLVPKPGYSNRRGASIDLAYYQTFGRTADSTFYLDASTNSYFGFGNETRWRPTEDSAGYFRAYLLNEPSDAEFEDPMRNPFDPTLNPGDTRWKAELFHESKNLWGKFRGVVDIKEYSDFDYLQDYERDANRQTNSFIYSRAFLSGNFGRSSLNIMVDQRDRITRPGDQFSNQDLRRQLPEVEYRLRSTRLGSSQVYFNLESSLHQIALDIDNGLFQIDDTYFRAHFQPQFSVPVSNLTWLSAKLDVGGRATFYDKGLAPAARLDPDDDTSPIVRQLSDDSVDRMVPEASLEVVGPVLSKIFDRERGRFAKVKHVIEPKITYNYLGDFDGDGFPDLDSEDRAIPEDDFFRFDEIDTLRASNGFVFEFNNRLIAKPRDESEGGAFEIASLQLRQAYTLENVDADPRRALQWVDLDGDSMRDPDETSASGPLRGTLRINPSRKFSFKTDWVYNTVADELQSTSFTGEKWFGLGDNPASLGAHKIGFSWFTTRNVLNGETTSDQLRVSAKVSLIPNRFSIDAVTSWDLDAGEDEPNLLQQRYFLNWQSQCYSWQLEYRESEFGNFKDSDIRFALTLKNVGTFLDLNESL